MNILQDKKGITIIEAIFALGIFSLVTAALTTLFISSLRWNDTIFDQLSAHTDGRKVVETSIRDIRKIEPSSIGSFGIESASANEFIFFANVDSDTLRERVRYTLTGSTLARGITKPSGSPLRYNTSTEDVIDVAHYVQNISVGVPLFSYYRLSYTGTESALTSPVTTTDIFGVKMQLELEKNIKTSPVPLHVEGFARIRNSQSLDSGQWSDCNEHGHDECDDN